MKYVEDVVGLTFAEIAFVLLYIIFANSFLIRDTKEALQSKLAEYEQYKEQVVLLEAELAKLKEEQELKSKITPNCIEKGIIRGNLFEVIIVDRNLYLIDGHFLKFEEIIEKYKTNLEEARRNGCVHRILVRYDGEISTAKSMYALKRLRQRFYTDIR